MPNVVIVGTGSELPDLVITNDHFTNRTYYTDRHNVEPYTTDKIMERLEETGIKERRYAREGVNASHLGAAALGKALDMAKITIDDIGFVTGATNFGDIRAPFNASDLVPNLGARVIDKVGYQDRDDHFIGSLDVVSGCPGFLEAMITAHTRLLAEPHMEYAAVVAMETLSRVLDETSKSSYLFGDGGGAAVLRKVPGDGNEGIIAWDSFTKFRFNPKRTDTSIDRSRALAYIDMGVANNPDAPENRMIMRLDGPSVYQIAVKYIPVVIERALEKAGLTLKDVNLINAHQMNLRLLKAAFNRMGIQGDDFVNLCPMTLDGTGNMSLVTTIYNLDLLERGLLINPLTQKPYERPPGSVELDVSAGAGFNLASVVRRQPQESYR